MKNRDVFINCPFSADFAPHFYAIVFTIIRSGFKPSCALEADDGAENRFDKICMIIAQCDYGIHDISKTEPDAHSGLPRFNMPLELALFLAAKKFGVAQHRRKKCIVFDKLPYRYQQFMSDISGQDIHSHNNSIPKLIEVLASWLRREAADKKVPGGNAIYREYRKFQSGLPVLCREIQLKQSELTFDDFRRMVEKWVLA